MPSHQGTVLRRVVHDQVDHDTEAHRPDRPDRVGERIDAPFPGARLEGRVEPVVFLDGVEAPREPRVTERVDVDPVEPHGAGTLGVRDPSVHGSHERREQVVDHRHHEQNTLAIRRQGRARRVIAFLHYEGSLPDSRVPPAHLLEDGETGTRLPRRAPHELSWSGRLRTGRGLRNAVGPRLAEGAFAAVSLTIYRPISRIRPPGHGVIDDSPILGRSADQAGRRVS